MSDKFRVILGDLTAAASTFHDEARFSDGILNGSAAPGPVDGGDAAFNSNLTFVLDDLAFLHASLVAHMQDHGDKLQQARDNYSQVDQSMHELFDDMVPKG